MRTVEQIFEPRIPHFVGDGFRVHNFIPSISKLSMERMSPFIMLDYNAPHFFPPTDTPRGVGVHPHRGFETVTIAYKGKISHHDSSGGGGTIEQGDVQWMTAASGVLHKEYHEKEWSKKGGEFQMVQLWVNLPKAHKMDPPKYQAITNNQIKKIELDDKKGYVEVIAGNYKNVKGIASTFSPINMFNVIGKAHAKFEFDFPENYNTALLVLEGEIKINNKEILHLNHFALMANDGTNFEIETLEDSKILVLSGEPINEPIAAHGPFVMNTRAELIQAFDDFNNGKFGYLD
ncbi:MAG: pirin family protein [Putridiphycobacter sp.]